MCTKVLWRKEKVRVVKVDASTTPSALQANRVQQSSAESSYFSCAFDWKMQRNCCADTSELMEDQGSKMVSITMVNFPPKLYRD